MGYKRKQTKWAKAQINAVKRSKVTSTMMKTIKLCWFEKYLKDEGYAEWYDKWCEGFRK